MTVLCVCKIKQSIFYYFTAVHLMETNSCSAKRFTTLTGGFS
jgi:hypothetical protein